MSIWKNVLKIDDLRVLAIILATIFITWVILAIPLGVYYLINDDAAGKLGDTFGVINSIFSSLAFGGLLYTILLQKVELAETKEEFKKQHQTFKRQKFESTFFNLLKRHNEITAFYVTRDSGGKTKFEILLRKLDGFIKQFAEIEMSLQMDFTIYHDLYKAFDDKYSYRTSDYFRSLVSIYNFISDSTDIADDEKGTYLILLRDQTSTVEAVFLYYHASLSDTGIIPNETLKELYLRGKFFSILERSLLLHPSHIILLYSVNKEYFKYLNIKDDNIIKY